MVTGAASSLPLPSLNTLPSSMEVSCAETGLKSCQMTGPTFPPQDFVTEVRQLRESRTGKFIARMYQQHREFSSKKSA